jgi:O-antigen ligase
MSIAPAAPVRRPMTRARSTSLGTVRLLGFLFVLAHVPLGLVIDASPTIATAHALLSGFVGITVAIVAPRPGWAAYAAGYIVGAEVLWRMAGAQVFWEFGKYSLVGILGLGLIRHYKRWKRAWLPISCFALLVPSAVITLDTLGFAEARQLISFNLSGPLALAVAVLFFSQSRLSWKQMGTIAWSVILPTISIATVTATNAAAAQPSDFGGESNFITSGGFGPNQVSAALGLGIMFALLIVIQERRRLPRLLALSFAMWFTVQSLLTFSRGGLFNVLLALVVGGVHYLRQPEKRIALLTTVGVVSVIVAFFIFPQLNSYTEGALEERFTDVNTTNRADIAEADIEIWKQNFFLGTGPGLARFERESVIVLTTAAHTEFTRLLAEHGVLGFVSLIFLLMIAWRAYRSATTHLHAAWCSALLAWSLAEMAHSAMRVASIAFVFGLATAWMGQTEGGIVRRIRRRAVARQPIYASTRARLARASSE